MRLALYQPDIPQNTGTLLRTAMCLDIAVDIIEPCGFVFSDRQLKRAAMDYLQDADVTRHSSWQSFKQEIDVQGVRLVLLSTKAETVYTDFPFRADDIIMVGRESAGVPDDVFAAAHAQLQVPMAPGARSLNVAIAAAMVLGEALRQTD
ncbi:MAG: tRNA (cytidine(34)-2'-O)-methyltransferase [Rhodospirillaceae bacterium]|jgi:tRNA (cytidine/uridine-2'-O-)-methyltransferase|nr:tRNA (cytidine(34)-2'-O)-methyltransferase [Rhodospirillaceae bacterium]MBT5243526.1 tRNA (cytidine(34)-2'-O)-methyltransferase [Rhodospirillaceae bacterium]MBT5562114.1 tRNA (cytidine(34)-2'-O)-methyltransferase [Rhodospirillaceae bacterium]MBT6242287.1 tRNA (cytidine(34)-2'-O)-methyltransferase [Rhodospirillaceae bacterium]MBT7137701.1 tRNA (cytidine(34)-2'-O)-methyltransferase [Rhodospirillaceae bacterium]